MLLFCAELAAAAAVALPAVAAAAAAVFKAKLTPFRLHASSAGLLMLTNCPRCLL